MTWPVRICMCPYTHTSARLIEDTLPPPNGGVLDDEDEADLEATDLIVDCIVYT